MSRSGPRNVNIIAVQNNKCLYQENGKCVCGVFVCVWGGCVCVCMGFVFGFVSGGCGYV